jgi:hypothetical protein
MDRAIALLENALATFRAIRKQALATTRITGLAAMVERVEAYLRRRHAAEVTRRELVRALHLSAADVAATVAHLVSTGRLEPLEELPGGAGGLRRNGRPPSPRYRVLGATGGLAAAEAVAAARASEEYLHSPASEVESVLALLAAKEAAKDPV